MSERDDLYYTIALRYALALRDIERQLDELARSLPFGGRNPLEDINLLFLIEDIAEYRLSGEYDQQLTETTANEAFARVVVSGRRTRLLSGADYSEDLKIVEELIAEAGA